MNEIVATSYPQVRRIDGEWRVFFSGGKSSGPFRTKVDAEQFANLAGKSESRPGRPRVIDPRTNPFLPQSRNGIVWAMLLSDSRVTGFTDRVRKALSDYRGPSSGSPDRKSSAETLIPNMFQRARRMGWRIREANDGNGVLRYDVRYVGRKKRPV